MGRTLSSNTYFSLITYLKPASSVPKAFTLCNKIQTYFEHQENVIRVDAHQNLEMEGVDMLMISISLFLPRAGSALSGP